MSKKPTNKGLSTLEKELLEYAGKGQPVLLYGKDTSCERVNLIKRIHLLNGGIDASWEYPGYNGNSKSSVVIHDAMTKALKEQGTKEAKTFLLECKNTSKTWRRVDCNFETGKEVFHVLNNKFELFSDGFNGRGLLETEESIKIRKLYKQHMDSLAKGYSFLFCRGLLFVDNLKCTRYDPEDHKWYLKLARSIESREKDRDSGDWLVVYAYDTKTFPQYFLDQFETKRLVSLDGEDAVIKEKQLAKKVLKKPYLHRGEHPDHTFYAVVKGEKKAIEKLSENTQAYTVLYTLYNSDTQTASIDVLISKCKIQKIKGGNHVPARRKKNLQTVISKLNSMLLDVFLIERIVKLNDSTGEYYLDIKCRN